MCFSLILLLGGLEENWIMTLHDIYDQPTGLEENDWSTPQVGHELA
jgi:hypothetical protein